MWSSPKPAIVICLCAYVSFVDRCMEVGCFVRKDLCAIYFVNKCPKFETLTSRYLSAFIRGRMLIVKLKFGKAGKILRWFIFCRYRLDLLIFTHDASYWTTKMKYLFRYKNTQRKFRRNVEYISSIISSSSLSYKNVNNLFLINSFKLSQKLMLWYHWISNNSISFWQKLI